MANGRDNALGTFLKDRRARLNPADFGLSMARRRTPGLRREEVAQRANISVTWYTWLEQGRGGAPSADVLNQIANALLLTAAEREHLFLLALSRPPDVSGSTSASVSPRLQCVLDALEWSPAFLKTAAWDVVAWNRAAAVVLTDYAALAPAERNILRLLFCDPFTRAKTPHWERHARFAVATFRLETARAGVNTHVAALVDDLSRASPEFVAMWRDNDVSTYGEGTKCVEDSVVGTLTLEYSSFVVDDQPNLGLVIYTPATSVDMERIRTLVTDTASELNPPSPNGC